MVSRITTWLILLFQIHQVAVAQGHLDYSYKLDAMVYSDGRTLFFIGHEYPVFKAHHSDSLLENLNSRFLSLDSQDLHQFDSLKLITSLEGLAVDELLTKGQILSMLKSRIGLMESKMRDTLFQSEMWIDVIYYPDNTEPVFNWESHQTIEGNALAHPSFQTEYAVVDWSEAALIKIGDMGGRKLMKCIDNAIENATFENTDCGDVKFKDAWRASIDCNVRIGSVSKESITFYNDPRNFGCPESKRRIWSVKIDRKCFEDDKSCAEE